jgi:peptidoglycan LD-endopeptidase LytH
VNAVLALGLVIGLAGAPAPSAVAADVEADPEVQEAVRRLTEAQAVVADTTLRLDAAAEAYENAQAHHLRLAEEAASGGDRVAAAQARVAAEQQAFAERIAAAYRRPDAGVVLAEAIVRAPDAPTVLHRAALVERIAERALAPVAQAELAEARTSDDVRQQRILEVGTLAAAQERQALAELLTVALGQGRHEVETAERAVIQAREAAAARIAEEERLRRLSMFTSVSGPLPPVDGKVCPIGAPNGFIDSWGFPRSGGRRHQGVDMFAAYGMPLYAVADGVISRVFNNRLGGLSIDLIDDRGDRYYYAHLSATHVVGGQRVVAGQVIGSNGDSGNARGTPPHLHWQYHPGNGPPVNPYPLAAALCRPR